MLSKSPKNFLKKFNFGLPEILIISFVSKLKILKRSKGKLTIKWAIRKSGFFLTNILFNSKKQKKK